MNYLYLDNIRGFSKTSIPLRDVNFLVGENSTGKTSVLAILERVSDPFFAPSFDLITSEAHEFGSFQDIVSASSDSKTEFTIGLCSSPNDKDLATNLTGRLWQFVEREGVPIVRRMVRIEHGKAMTVALERKSLGYQVDSLERFKSTGDDLSTILAMTDLIARELNSKFSPFPAMPTEFSERWSDISADVQQEIKETATIVDLSSIALRPLRNGMVSIAPIRTKPRRTYDGYAGKFSSEGVHTPYLLRQRLAVESSAKKYRDVLERFGRESGLFKKVGVHSFGNDPSAPFEVTVTLDDKPLRVNSVGYGVSQILPILVELIERPAGTTFSIQQPEIHLHPRAQAALGDLLFTLAQIENKRFFIETHSDYILDRFRLNYREANSVKPDAQVLFFERVANGNRVQSIPILEDGEYPEDQPAEFRAFFLDEQRRLLGI